MPKPLTYYCGSRVDEPLFKQLEEKLKMRDKEIKLHLAVFALMSVAYPGDEITTAPWIAEEEALCNKLSASGKLELAQALITEVREP